VKNIVYLMIMAKQLIFHRQKYCKLVTLATCMSWLESQTNRRTDSLLLHAVRKQTIVCCLIFYGGLVWRGRTLRSAETHWAYVPAAVASSRMGDHPGFLATYIFATNTQIYVLQPTNLNTYKQTHKNNPYRTSSHSIADCWFGFPL